MFSWEFHKKFRFKTFQMCFRKSVNSVGCNRYNLHDELVKTVEEVGVRLLFEGKSIRLGDEVIDPEREWKPTWRKVKTCLQKAIESRRTENYKKKEQQSQFYQEQENKCHLWLSQNYYYYYCYYYYYYYYYYHRSRHWE